MLAVIGNWGILRRVSIAIDDVFMALESALVVNFNCYSIPMSLNLRLLFLMIMRGLAGVEFTPSSRLSHHLMIITRFLLTIACCSSLLKSNPPFLLGCVSCKRWRVCGIWDPYWNIIFSNNLFLLITAALLRCSLLFLGLLFPSKSILEFFDIRVKKLLLCFLVLLNMIRLVCNLLQHWISLYLNIARSSLVGNLFAEPHGSSSSMLLFWGSILTCRIINIAWQVCTSCPWWNSWRSLVLSAIHDHSLIWLLIF